MRLYKIGEFSKMTELTIKALRYYDEMNLLKPTSINEDNGYRFYDDSAYKKARMIVLLRRHEFTIQEMLEALPQIQELEDLASFLSEKHQQHEIEIQKFKRHQQAIEIELSRLKEVLNMTHENQTIEIKMTEPVLVASIRYTGKYCDMGQYIGELMKAVGGNACGPITALYYDEAFMDDKADIEVTIPVKKVIEKGRVTTRELPAQKCVCMLHVGPYESLSKSYKAITDYVVENGIKTMTPSRESYLKGPGMLLKGNPDKYETELLLPIEE